MTREDMAPRDIHKLPERTSDDTQAQPTSKANVSSVQQQRRRRDIAVRDGLELVGIVRDFGVDTITEYLRRRDRTALEGIAVALAAMVPDDRTASDLLAWLEDPSAPKRDRPAVQLRRPCATHAAFARHKARGEALDDACVQAERLYQRDRKRALRQAS